MHLWMVLLLEIWRRQILLFIIIIPRTATVCDPSELMGVIYVCRLALQTWAALQQRANSQQQLFKISNKMETP